MIHRPKLLIILLIAALAMTAAGTIAAPNWIARSPALAMFVVLGATGVYVLSARDTRQKKPWGDHGA
jgi:CHASE2 domain-containing sensor protein